MKIWLPADPSRRALLVAIVCSVLLHVLVAASVYLAGAFAPKIVAKRGEPLFVDITPEPPAPKMAEVKPKAPEVPRSAPPKAPAPSQVAKASPPPAPETPAPRTQEPA